MYENWIPNAKEDDMIIFPAALQHDIPLHSSDELRVTISTNIEVNAPPWVERHPLRRIKREIE